MEWWIFPDKDYLTFPCRYGCWWNPHLGEDEPWADGSSFWKTYFVKNIWGFANICTVDNRIIAGYKLANQIYSLHHSICSMFVQTFGSWIISVIRLLKLYFYFPVDFTKWVYIPSFIFSISNNIIIRIKALLLYRATDNIQVVFPSSLEG